MSFHSYTRKRNRKGNSAKRVARHPRCRRTQILDHATMQIRHIGWALSGLTIPLVVALTVVPHLISNIGPERFGILALAWALMTYGGAFDLGIGRAVTQLVSSMRETERKHDIAQSAATAIRITLASGLLGGLLLALSAPFASDMLKAPDIPKDELFYAILILAIAIPAQALVATYRGISEAFAQFRQVSILRMIIGIMNFLGPFFLSLFTENLLFIIAPLVLSRLIAVILFRRATLRCIAKEPGQPTGFSKAYAKRLFRFGSWATISSVVSPLMLHSDRFFIGAIIGASAITSYVVPYEVVVQSLIIVGSITSVAFPALSGIVTANPKQLHLYFRMWLIRVVVLMAFLSSAMALSAPYLMSWWLEDVLDPNSILVAQVLCVGVFTNSIGGMYYSLIQATGRADITAKIHLAELVPYIALVVFLITHNGVAGAALAWSVRTTVDAFVLASYSRRFLCLKH